MRNIAVSIKLSEALLHTSQILAAFLLRTASKARHNIPADDLLLHAHLPQHSHQHLARRQTAFLARMLFSVPIHPQAQQVIGLVGKWAGHEIGRAWRTVSDPFYLIGRQLENCILYIYIYARNIIM